MRRGLTRSDWQPRSSQFGSLLPLCFCEGSRNTSSAIHFISIPTPASHLHSVSFTSSFSFLRVPLHFLNDNAVTFSLAVHRPGHNATCIQSREKWKVFVRNMLIFPFFFPQTSFSPSASVPLLLSGFHQRPTPLNLLIKSRSLLHDPYETLRGSVAPPGTLVRIMSHLSTATTEPGAQ